MKKGVLRNFTKFRGKRLCQSLFFNKGLQICYKRDSGTSYPLPHAFMEDTIRHIVAQMTSTSKA